MSDNIITITDFMDPNLDVYARLTENQLLNRANPKEGMFIAESPKVIERALDAGCEPVSLLMETKHVNGEARGIIERCQNIPVYTASFDLLTKLTGFALTRGTLCAMYRPKPRSVEEVCRDARRVAVLEDVVNPTNVGAIFRSAAALGIDAVLLTRNSCDPLNRRAVPAAILCTGVQSGLVWERCFRCHGHIFPSTMSAVTTLFQMLHCMISVIAVTKIAATEIAVFINTILMCFISLDLRLVLWR